MESDFGKDKQCQMDLQAHISNGIVSSPYPDGDIPKLSMYQAIKQRMLLFGNKTALVENDVTMTHLDVLEKIHRYAAGFQKNGVRPGEHVCVHLNNSMIGLVAMYSVVCAGATAVLAEPELGIDDLRKRMKTADVKHVLTDSFNSKKILHIKEDLSLQGMFAVDAVPEFVSLTDFEDLPVDTFKEIPVADVEEEIATISFTSGTTGASKPVAAKHWGYTFNFFLDPPDLFFHESDVLVLWNTLAHSFSFRVSMQAVCAGSTVVLVAPKFGIDQLASVVRKHKVNMMFGLPLKFQWITTEMERTATTLDSINKIYVCGDLMSRALAERITSTFKVTCFKSVYGSTESGGASTIAPPGDICHESTGFLVPRAQLKVVDVVTGETLGPDEYGEIYIKSPVAMKGYYKMPKETAAVLSEDGWLKSGDLGYYDRNGRVYFLQRLKEIIKSLDSYVVPRELEKILLTHPAVAEAAVIGTPVPSFGEAACAFVVLKECHTNSKNFYEEELRSFVADKTPVHKHLHGGVFFLDSIPQSPNGKMWKHKLQELALQQTTDSLKTLNLEGN